MTEETFRPIGKFPPFEFAAQVFLNDFHVCLDTGFFVFVDHFGHRDILVRPFLQSRHSSRRASIFEEMMDSSITFNDFPAPRCFNRDLDATRNFSTACGGAVISHQVMKPPGYSLPPFSPTHDASVQLPALSPFAHFLAGRRAYRCQQSGGRQRAVNCAGIGGDVARQGQDWELDR